MKKILYAVVFLYLVIFINPSVADASNQVDPGTSRIILKFKAVTPKFSQDNLFKSYGFGKVEKLNLPDTFVVEMPKGQLGDLFNRLKQSFLLEYVEEDHIATISDIPNDEKFSYQWGLEKIKGPSAWDITHGSQNVKIAIIDTGINGTHPDLGSKIVGAYDCTSNSGCFSTVPQDNNGHGTHVAGIVSAISNNGIGVAGVAWDGKLMSIKALDDSGSGYYSWCVNAIYWAVNNGAKVINLSMGSGNSSDTLKRAIDYAWGNGVVVVAAAGNNGSNRKYYPAYYSNAIAVAATDQNDSRTSFSNYGTWVDVAAPGISIYSTYKDGYDYMSGTSMSAPFVSGLAALVIGQNPTWSNSQIRNKIETTSDKIKGSGVYFAYGRINACQAVGCNLNPNPSPAPTNTPTPSPTITPIPTATPTIKPSSTPTPLYCKYRPWRCK